MICISEYSSPLGKITLAGDETAIIGLWFSGQKYFGNIICDRNNFELSDENTAETGKDA